MKVREMCKMMFKMNLIFRQSLIHSFVSRTNQLRLVKDLLHKIMVGKESIEVELTIGTRINGLLEEIVVGTLDG